jgi:hypothetical protein
MLRPGLLVVLVAWVVLLASGAARAEPLVRPRYALSARLDPEAGVLHGRARIHWQNRSRAPVRELYFHLYANAFEHEQTLFMREGGRHLRDGRLTRRGGIELRALELVRDGRSSDLLARAERELWPKDRTQLRVTLPAPLLPGAALELAIEFELRVPSLFARMGRAGDFFMLGQWYPKLAKHEPDGRWVSFPYHATGEFYADFADHTLELQVPSEYVIAAPGSLLGSEVRSDGTRLERYRFDRALDVAWAAYPGFRRERARAGSVQLEAFAPAGHSALVRSQLALIRDGLARLGQRLGPYPYDRFVLVLPPANAGGAAGMEYPGLILGATTGWHSELGASALAVHDLTTTHELAHQWFPLLIASNELAEPVLDEGLSQWLGLDLLRGHGRTSVLARLAGLPFDAFELMRAGFMAGRNVPSSLLPAWRYRPSQLGPAVYGRPALVLETLRRTHGEARLWRALGRYAREQRHAHPRLEQLLAAFDAEYRAGFGRDVLVPLLEGRAANARLARAGGTCPTAVSAVRDGIALPSELTLSGAGGAHRSQPWPATASEIHTRCEAERMGAAIDDQRRNLLDASRSDDQLRLSARAPQPAWLPRLFHWAQLLLALVGA